MAWGSPSCGEMSAKRPTDYDKRVAMQLFAQAHDAWTETGRASVRCDACGGLIEFRKQGSATHHDCLCGKFQGVMQSYIRV